MFTALHVASIMQVTVLDTPYPLFVAKYNYQERTKEDLSLKKGDLVYIINMDGDWWYALSKETGRKGFVPMNYLAAQEDSAI